MSTHESVIFLSSPQSNNRGAECNSDVFILQTRKRKPKSGTPKSESSGGGGSGGANSSSVQQTPSIVKLEHTGTVLILGREREFTFLTLDLSDSCLNMLILHYIAFLYWRHGLSFGLSVSIVSVHPPGIKFRL